MKCETCKQSIVTHPVSFPDWKRLCRDEDREQGYHEPHVLKLSAARTAEDYQVYREFHRTQ